MSFPAVRRELRCGVNSEVHPNVLVRDALREGIGNVRLVNMGLNELCERGVLERRRYAPWMLTAPCMSCEATPLGNPRTAPAVHFYHYVRGAWWLTPKHWHILHVPALTPWHLHVGAARYDQAHAELKAELAHPFYKS